MKGLTETGLNVTNGRIRANLEIIVARDGRIVFQEIIKNMDQITIVNVAMGTLVTVFTVIEITKTLVQTAIMNARRTPCAR